ncbi:DUF2914 domain-containing protein [candidate division KSB1 bacterium]|nr:DUF2914 domain-containing protein [candidate division KSB1 bacterium]
MPTNPIKKIDILKQFVEEKNELEDKLKTQKEKLAEIKFTRKNDPEAKSQIAELTFELNETKRNLQHADRQVKWFATQIGGSAAISKPILLYIAFGMLIIGCILGYFVIPFLVTSAGVDPISQLDICLSVENGVPVGTKTAFEIAQSKSLTCYLSISSRAYRPDYYIDWLFKNNLKESTRLSMRETGGPTWGKKTFTLADLGDWEARLRTGDGNVLRKKRFKLIYPKIEVTRAMVCENVVNNEPQNPRELFLAQNITLHCYSEIQANEKYTEIIHEWIYDNQKINRKVMQLDELESKQSSFCHIKDSQTGTWTVNILNGNGEWLKSVRFDVQSQQAFVPEIQMCTALVDGKPDTSLNSFSADGRTLFAYSATTSNFPGFQIKHRWMHNSQPQFEKAFNFDSDSGQAVSSMKIPASQAGLWLVQAIDQHGTVVANKSINITRPTSADVKVTRLVFCRTIFQRDPYDIASNFDLSYDTEIYAHATIQNSLSEVFIVFYWYYGDKLEYKSRQYSISKSTSYRTYTYKTVSPAQKGTWRVAIRAADGSLLKEASFTVN